MVTAEHLFRDKSQMALKNLGSLNNDHPNRDWQAGVNHLDLDPRSFSRHMKVMKLNSVMFHTSKLSEIREFYEHKLKLVVGTYVKENQTVPDCSESYVNFHLDGGTLLCFEAEDGRVDGGSVVLNVESLSQFRQQMEKMGIKSVGGTDHYIKIKDPEGRTLIIEPIR